MPRFSFRNIVQLTKKQLDKKKVEANRQLQNNNNALNKNIKVLEDEAKNAKAQVESVAEEVKVGKKEKKALNTSLKSLIKKHSQAESILIGKKSKLDEISQKAQKLYGDVAYREKRLETLNKAIEMANAVKPDIVKLKSELQSVNQELMKKKLDLDDLVNQEDVIKDRVKKIADDYEEKTKPYEKSLDKIKEKQPSLRKKYKEEIITLENGAKDVEREISKHQNTLKGYDREIVAAKSLLNDEADKVKDATEQIKQLEREKAILMRNIAESKKSYEGWKIKEMEKVAKQVLKGRLENIDKAGLKDALNAV
jgi:chromosome segregation ATPase